MILLILDKVIPHLHRNANETEGPKSKLTRSSMLVLAVALHNLPEGMAVGAVLAGAMHGDMAVSGAGALALSIGIAVQNFPEGAAVALPLRQAGFKRGKAFFYGSMSGIVEPIFAVLTVLISSYVASYIPFFLSFAAGAMYLAVVKELIPQAMEASENESSPAIPGSIGAALGFLIMMILDISL